ncbi:MAG: acyltransferase [Victivallaceae bacterium]|nr:acyltransferase [Victivallaceae bacterium]
MSTKPTEVTEQTSIALRLLSYCAVITVLIIHSKSYLNLPHTEHWNLVFQKSICDIWTGWAVPYFFLVSGFFFVSAHKRDYFSLIKVKIHTLFIPYVSWAVIGAIVQAFSSILISWYMHRDIFANTILQYRSWSDGLNALFGITSYDMIGNGLVGPLGNRPLWYVRTLLIIFLFSPLLKSFYIRVKKGLMLLSLLCIFIWPDSLLPLIDVKLFAIGYFCLGMVLREYLHRIRIDKIFMAADFVFVLLLLLLSFYDDSRIMLYQRLLPLSTIYLLWCAVCRIHIRQNVLFLNFSFWIYCSHSLIIGNIIVGFFLLFGKSNPVSLIATLCAPVIALLICVFAGNLLKKIHAPAYDVLTGGR